jgi:hypothetical protein
MERLKNIFACGGSEMKLSFKSKCFSKCCKRTEIDIDVDGDGKKDLTLKKVDSEIELVIHKE